MKTHHQVFTAVAGLSLAALALSACAPATDGEKPVGDEGVTAEDAATTYFDHLANGEADEVVAMWTLNTEEALEADGLAWDRMDHYDLMAEAFEGANSYITDVVVGADAGSETVLVDGDDLQTDAMSDIDATAEVAYTYTVGDIDYAGTLPLVHTATADAWQVDVMTSPQWGYVETDWSDEVDPDDWEDADRLSGTISGVPTGGWAEGPFLPAVYDIDVTDPEGELTADPTLAVVPIGDDTEGTGDHNSAWTGVTFSDITIGYK